MRLIIAGSRNITVPPEALTWHVMVVERIAAQITSKVVCGMAPGIDTVGLAWARKNGLPVDEHPADWHKHGRAAGPLRNRQMAANADALLLVWDGKSKGSASMKREAEAAGLLIHEVIA